MSKYDFRQQGDLDASLGLIMRLNKHWYEADEAADQGNFAKWNIKLDTIFRNLCFKESLDIELEDGKVISVKLCKQDRIAFEYLNKTVKEASKRLATVKSKKEYLEAKEKLYEAMQLKDIGVRKFMQQLKLYLKQGDGNPANAMWGG